MTKKEIFLNFLNKDHAPDYVPFQPILIHFASRFNDNTPYTNIKAMRSALK